MMRIVILLCLLFVAPSAFARLVDLPLGNLTCPNAFTVRVNTIADPQLNGAELLGDFNGDGRNDIAIGSPQYDPIGVDNGGRACVVYRPTVCQPTIEMGTVSNGIGGFCMEGNVANAQLGIRIAAVGDLNGDGREDIAFNDLGFRSSIVFGTANMINGPLQPTSLNGSNGFTIGRQFTAPFPVGDFNGDGIDDLGLSLISPARLCVLFGKTSGWTGNIDPSTMNLSGSGVCMTGPPGSTWPVTGAGFRKTRSGSSVRKASGASAHIIGAASQGAGWTLGLWHAFPAPYDVNYAFGATSPFTTFTYPSGNINCFSSFGARQTSAEDVSLAIGCSAGDGPSSGYLFNSADALESVPTVNLISGWQAAGASRFQVPDGREIKYITQSLTSDGYQLLSVATGQVGLIPGLTEVVVYHGPPLPPGSDVLLEPAALEARPEDWYSIPPLTPGEFRSAPTLRVDPDGDVALAYLERISPEQSVVRAFGDLESELQPVFAPIRLQDGFEGPPGPP